MPHTSDLGGAIDRLETFLDGESLTQLTASLERSLEGQLGPAIGDINRLAGVDENLLQAALRARSALGRINDVIHAAAITLSLPHLLIPGEKISNRPSLAAGNDPSRPFDVETNRRIAEFKLARWTGADSMRKRQAFKDLFKLAIDSSGRQAELYVVGHRPIHFLTHSVSTARWALNRNTTVATEFTERFGSLDIPVYEFTATHASHVRMVDLTVEIPDLFGALA